MTAKIFYEVPKSWQFSEKRFTEAATGDVLQKKVFLKILETSQENTCVGVSF